MSGATIGSERYRLGVAWTLMVVYTLNLMDRQVLSVVLPQIQAEFGVSDAVAGLLHGTAFALFYVTLALPIARWADVGNRVRIITLATLVWGAMTALCGMARSFPMLFLARVGVGVGEAGCSPAAYSLLSGYFPPEKRSGAMAIYGAGVPVGSALGLAFGGLLAQIMDWRSVFILFGLPSVVVALFVLLFVKEPPRANSGQVAHPKLSEVGRRLWSKRAFRHATWATALLAFGGYGSAAWAPTFLVRVHEMPVALVGVSLAAITLLGAFPAAIGGGWLTDRIAQRDPRWRLRLPALAMLLATPFSIAAFLLPSGQPGAYWIVVALFLVPTAASAVYFGPVLGVLQGIVSEPMRATATAIFLFVTNLVGMGAGPLVVGISSDLLRESLGADSVRWALLLPCATTLLAAAHYWRGADHLRKDLDAET